jgi:hypothetical protein
LLAAEVARLALYVDQLLDAADKQREGLAREAAGRLASNLLQAFAPCLRRRRASASAASTDHAASPPPRESLRE